MGCICSVDNNNTSDDHNISNRTTKTITVTSSSPSNNNDENNHNENKRKLNKIDDYNIPESISAVVLDKDKDELTDNEIPHHSNNVSHPTIPNLGQVRFVKNSHLMEHDEHVKQIHKENKILPHNNIHNNNNINNHNNNHNNNNDNNDNINKNKSERGVIMNFFRSVLSGSDKSSKKSGQKYEKNRNKSKSKDLNKKKRNSLITTEDSSSSDSDSNSLSRNNSNNNTSESSIPRAILRRPAIPIIDNSSASNIQKFADLKSTILSHCMNDKELEQFAELFTVFKFKAGETIYYQNTVADFFYIIRTGELAVQVDKKQYTIARAKSRANLLKKGTFEEEDDDSNIKSILKHDRGNNNRSLHSLSRYNVNSAMNDSTIVKLAVKSCGEFIGIDALIPTAPMKTESNISNNLIITDNNNNIAHHEFAVKSVIVGRNIRGKGNKTKSSFTHTYDINIYNDNNHNHNHNNNTHNGQFSNTTSPTSEITSFNQLYHSTGLRDCSVISLTDSTCLGLSRSRYEDFISRNSAIQSRILYTCSNYMESSLSKNALFRALSRTKLRLLAGLFKHNYIGPQEIIFNEGDEASDESCLYFIYSGSVHLEWIDDKNKVQTKKLTAGESFGELSLLVDIRRTATASTAENCILFELTRAGLRYFLFLEPSLMAKAKDKILEGTINMSHLIANPVIRHHFTQFCEHEHSTENLQFWLIAQKFFREAKFLNENKQFNVILRQAKEIISIYIDSYSESLINISSGCRKRLLDAIDEAEEFPHEFPLNEKLFLEAENEIFALMRQDSFPRFKQSKLFKQAIEQLNTVQPVDDETNLISIPKYKKKSLGVQLASPNNANNQIRPAPTTTTNNNNNPTNESSVLSPISPSRPHSSTLDSSSHTSSHKNPLLGSTNHTISNNHNTGNNANNNINGTSIMNNTTTSNLIPSTTGLTSNNRDISHRRSSSRPEVIHAFLKQRQQSSRNLLAEQDQKNRRIQTANQALAEVEKARILAATTPITHQTIDEITKQTQITRKRDRSHQRSVSTLITNSHYFNTNMDSTIMEGNSDYLNQSRPSSKIYNNNNNINSSRRTSMKGLDTIQSTIITENANPQTASFASF